VRLEGLSELKNHHIGYGFRDLPVCSIVPYPLRYLMTKVQLKIYFITIKNSLAGSTSELYRPSDHRISVKLVSTFWDRGYHVDSVTDLYGRIIGFLIRSRYL
jgi:hypothetical protein